MAAFFNMRGTNLNQLKLSASQKSSIFAAE